MVIAVVSQKRDHFSVITLKKVRSSRDMSIVSICKTVVNLLTRLGFISIEISVIAKTAIPVTINISRLSTITASQAGRILRTARLTKADDNNSLSAIGSR